MAMDRKFGVRIFATLIACLAAFAAEAQSPVASGPAPMAAGAVIALKPFSARYKVEAFGFTAGTADITLTAGTEGHYEYRTSLNPRGLFRLAVPSGATLTTWVETDGATVRPLRYREDDGSRDTDKDVALDFDWPHGIVQGTSHEEPVRLNVPVNAQDPMSLQLAVLTDFANGREPHSYAMVDKTKVKQYQYRSEGRVRIQTELGALDTVVYSSTRPGSSKVTRVWYAPSLDYLAVRSEDHDNGRLRVRMSIISVKR